MFQDAVSTFLLKKACKAACTKGPLKRNNEEEDETLTMDDVTVDDLIALGHIHGDNDAPLAKRDGASFGHKVCIAGCEVLCNSTVLALAQTKCLAKCVRIAYLCLTTHLLTSVVEAQV